MLGGEVVVAIATQAERILRLDEISLRQERQRSLVEESTGEERDQFGRVRQVSGPSEGSRNGA
jgi:hypothetical protein